MQDLRDRASIRIDKNLEIPSIPLVVSRILQLLNDDAVTAHQLEEVVRHDPSLSLRILKIANSAFYSFRHEVKAISHAIALLGLNLVKSLAIGVSIFETFTKGNPGERLLINRLWMHSFGTGVLSQAVWALRRNPKEGEFAFLCGLLHDIGKAVLFKHDAAQYSKLLVKHAKEPGPDLCTLEMEQYGYDHATLGALLIAKWRLPTELATVVREHHHALDSGSELVCTVALSDHLARVAGIGYKEVHADEEEAKRLKEQLVVSEDEVSRLAALADYRRADVEGFFGAYWSRG